jgi:hypothetical protein
MVGSNSGKPEFDCKRGRGRWGSPTEKEQTAVGRETQP